MVLKICKALLATNDHSGQADTTPWSKYIAPGVSLLMMLLFPCFLSAAIPYPTAYEDFVHWDSEPFTDSSYNFFQYLHFGGLPMDAETLPPPPNGDGLFRGRISYQGAPASGITLSVTLNSKYNANGLVTDAEGVFSISLPPDTWTINSLQTQGWKDKPETGSFSLYYGGEEKLVGDQYNQYAFYNRPGHKVRVNTEPDQIHLEIWINEDLTLLWPPQEERQTVATIEDTIRWEPYPGVEQYFVEVQKVERRGSSTTYTPVASTVLSNENALPLSGMKHTFVKKEVAEEYAVALYGFSSEGVLIAQTSEKYMQGTFLLSDGNILIDRKYGPFFDSASLDDPGTVEETLSALVLNDRRAGAVLVLLEENLLAEAETVLNLMDSDLSLGRKEALFGYLLALQGECHKATAMFDKAQVVYPGVCIPDEYRSRCE